MLNNKKI